MDKQDNLYIKKYWVLYGSDILQLIYIGINLSHNVTASITIYRQSSYISLGLETIHTRKK